MEKYKKWTDPGTGINAFVPLKRNENKLQKFLIGPILAVIRLFFLSIFFATLLLLIFVCSFIPLWFIRRPLLRYINALICRAILLFCGFFNISTTDAYPTRKSFNLKQNVEPLSKRFGKALGLNVHSGDLIICNHVSYIELFYLAFKYDPIFASVVLNNKKDDHPKVVRQSLIGCFLHTAFPEIPLNASEAQTLEEVLLYAKKNHKGPVVVFPEGVTTNGRGILKYQPIFDGLASKINYDINVHVIGFRFIYDKFPPSFPAGSFFSHLFSLCSQVYNTMQVRNVYVEDTTSATASSSSSVDTTSSSTSAATKNSSATAAKLGASFIENQVRGQLAAALGIRPVSLTAQDKLEFLEYFNKTQTLQYT